MKQKENYRIRDYRFPALLLAAGLLFLCITGNWKLYTNPMKTIGKHLWKVFGIDLFYEWDPAWDVQEEPEPDWEWEAQIRNADPEPVLEAQEEPEMQEETAEESPDEIPVPVFASVEDDYFENALFIGDSRVVGMHDYGKLTDKADFFASTGLTIYKLFTAPIVQIEGSRQKITVEEALQLKRYDKIYLMVGINELGTGNAERFEKTYREAVEHILEYQPDAIIYIQSIMKVTAKRSAEGDYINNPAIDERNNAIMQIADDRQIFYLNVNEAVCDESGGLNPEFTTDGVHLKAKYIPEWKQYLKDHAIVMKSSALQESTVLTH